jgi:protein-S-isoprenylcysteine O-methyltransferase Ste14
VSTRTKTVIQILAVTFGIALVSFEFRAPAWNLTNVAGLVLLVSGMALWITARLQLGDSFSVSAQARQLVTHGLYSKISNPIYVFGLLMISGLALVAGKPIWLLALLVIVPLQIMRARTEAKVLEDKFGDAYREYRRKTWF